MGYGYAETFLVIFLTHPGVILPTTTSVASLLPPSVGAAIPTQGTPIAASALWQVMWAWILSLPGERSAAFGWTMYALYLVFLALYAYLGARMRLTKGI